MEFFRDAVAVMVLALNMPLNNVWEGKSAPINLSQKTCPKAVQRAAMHSVRTKRFRFTAFIIRAVFCCAPSKKIREFFYVQVKKINTAIGFGGCISCRISSRSILLV